MKNCHHNVDSYEVGCNWCFTLHFEDACWKLKSEKYILNFYVEISSKELFIYFETDYFKIY